MDLVSCQPRVLALGEALRARRWQLGTAESCTGGLIAAACTAVAGSSDWFERGVVTYSNAAKSALLGVPATHFDRHGAVSEPVALAMASGLCRVAPVQLAVAVTGIAGPGGATPDKPVGTVWMAWAMDGRPAWARRHHFAGDRASVREQAVRAALEGLLQALEPFP